MRSSVEELHHHTPLQGEEGPQGRGSGVGAPKEQEVASNEQAYYYMCMHMLHICMVIGREKKNVTMHCCTFCA